ncbi:MAG: ATP-binding cassette domain-containing protein [Chloroflexota bacterium]
MLAVQALDHARAGHDVASVIGPNSAGKTTFFNCIAGFYRIDEGRIVTDSHEIHRLPSHKMQPSGAVQGPIRTSACSVACPPSTTCAWASTST